MNAMLRTAAALAIAMTFAFGATLATAEDKKETEKDYSISDVMKKGHKGKTSLSAKVAKGKATEKEMKTLMAMYKSIAKKDPPEGDKDSWKKKMDALIAALEACMKDEDGAEKKFQKAVNCKGCHEAHKG